MTAAAVVGVLGVIATAASSVLTAWIGKYRTRQEKQAAHADLAAQAAAAVQDVYGDLIADMRAEVQAARGETQSSRDAAREAQRQAQAAEENAYQAQQALRSVQRFLMELRPLLETYVPEPAGLLARLDNLTGTKPATS